jgi:hypothetical protein
LGDSDAEVKYSITSARILGGTGDNYVVDGVTTTSPYVEDVISHNYPFHIDMNLSKSYSLSKATDSSFQVSISWPLDSDNNELDSLWGSAAYEFQKSEADKKTADSSYQIKPSIQIVISLTAEQYIAADTSSDTRYNLGDTILFDVVNNSVCTEINSTCLKTYVIDVNNKLGDTAVTLLPDPSITYLNGTYSNYSSSLSTITSGWTVNTRSLLVSDLLKAVSTDITGSLLIRNGISDSIIGNLSYDNRINTEIAKAISYNGYYSFVNTKFSYFPATSCYWTNSEYNTSNGFAAIKINETNSKIYGEAKTSSCNVIPVILANKSNL